MPYRKKTYRKRKRKTNRNFLTQTGGGLSPAFPMAKTFKMKTRYVDIFELNPGVVGTPATKVFSLNGLYDPDITGIGHQPIGFDEIMPLYDHYTVIGARARLTFTNGDPNVAQRIILQLKDQSTTSTNISEILENGMSRWCVASKEGGGKDTCTLSINCSMNKFFGKKTLTEHDYRGGISSNPTEQVYLHCTAAPLDGVDSIGVKCTLVIEYIAIFHEPKQLTQS